MEYGASLRPLWGLDPDFITVNHGSFGATPLCVLEAQTVWRARMEAQPSRFMRRELGPALRAAAAGLAQFLGAEADDLAFVDNATSGSNAVLRSLPFAPGDEIVVFDHGYAAVRNCVNYVATATGANIVVAALPFPRPNDDAIVAALTAVVSPRTRLVVVDHITSPSAVVMPIARLVAACRDAGVAVLVDGAHGAGQVAVDLTAIGADYYTGNCHKWLMAPKGCGFLHVRRDRQAGLHPLSISHGYQKGFLAEFDWTGTADFSAYLAVTEAIAFHERLGGAALRARNVRLADEGARHVATKLGTETSEPLTQPGSMAMIRLPVAPASRPDRVEQLGSAILDARADAPLHILNNEVWVRISAQAYNDVNDFDRLATALATCLA